MDFLPWSTFTPIVARYCGDQRVRTLSCAEHYRAMAFAQLTYRESLRDIETCLSVQTSKLYSMGLRDPVRRSTLADANEARDWRIYAELAQRLIGQARRLYVNEALGFDLANTVYALDSTTIDLCLAVFPWAHFRTTKACPWRKQGAAVKMHTLLDLRGNIPSFIHVSDGNLHDVHALDPRFREGRLCCSRRRARSTSWIGALSISPGSMCCISPELLRHPRQIEHGCPSGLFGPDRPCDWYHLRSDHRPLPPQGQALDGHYTSQHYPEHLRRIRFRDAETGRTLVFLTNQFGFPAATICALYKSRWQVELFFKWIKRHLRIKRFFGTSENAVKTQIWIAVSVYVLVAIVKKRLPLDASLYTLLQILSVTLFEKIPIDQALAGDDTKDDASQITNQLNLFAY